MRKKKGKKKCKEKKGQSFKKIKSRKEKGQSLIIWCEKEKRKNEIKKEKGQSSIDCKKKSKKRDSPNRDSP